MASWLFWIYAQKRGQLESEERLDMMAAVQAGTGHMSQQGHKEYLDELKGRIREGMGGAAPRGARPSTLEDLARVGGTKLIVVENTRKKKQ